MGSQLLSPEKEHSPQFSAHVYCSQTAEWIKMPVGTKVGLGPGNIVLYADPVPSPKGHRPSPKFAAHVCCGQPAGWIKMSLGTTVQARLCYMGIQLPQRCTHPNFWPMSIVAKRSPISATAEHLLSDNSVEGFFKDMISYF